MVFPKHSDQSQKAAILLFESLERLEAVLTAIYGCKPVGLWTAQQEDKHEL